MGVIVDSTESSVALQWNLSRSLMGLVSSVKGGPAEAFARESAAILSVGCAAQGKGD